MTRHTEVQSSEKPWNCLSHNSLTKNKTVTVESIELMTVPDTDEADPSQSSWF